MMKDRIFSKSRIGFGFNTEVLEEILQEYLDPDIKVTDVTHPKYVEIIVHNSCHSLRESGLSASHSVLVETIPEI